MRPFTKGGYKRFAMMNAPKPEPIHEAVITTAHSVRNLRICYHCNGTGMKDGMVSSGNWAHPNNELFHPQCYLARGGFRAVTRLPLNERNKYRIKDLSPRQMRRILDLAATADGGPDHE